MIIKIFRRVIWGVMPHWQNTPIAETFRSLAKVMKLPVGQNLVSADSESVVFRYSEAGQTFYIKRFSKTRGLRSWLGQSRLRGEWNNLKLFEQLSIPAARIVAYGEERVLTKAGRGALITESLENTCDLAHMAYNNDPRLHNNDWVRQVLKQVAFAAEKMHNNRFAHNDFKWRNILVDDNIENPKIYLIDCPAGQRWFGPFLRYRIIKDLACLDKLGKYNLTRSQRLYFFKLYRKRQGPLTRQDKKMIRHILRFFEGRE